MQEKNLLISKCKLFGYVAVEFLWLVGTNVCSFQVLQSQEKTTLLCCYILVKLCILMIKFSTLYVRYLQSLSCEFFLVVYPESRSGKPLTFSIHIFLLMYRKSSSMRIMNTPTADRNPIASGDTKRNRKKHIF